MIPAFPPTGGETLRFWRIDQKRFAPQWDTGEGAFLTGGRWNAMGVRAVYASLDPATACLERAVHTGFSALDLQPHVLTVARIADPADVHVVMPEEVPNPNWLVPATPGRGQQAFGNALLEKHVFVALPSVVSRHSWNLIFDPLRAAGHYTDVAQEAFALDPRVPS